MQLVMLYLRMQVHPRCGVYPHTAKIAHIAAISGCLPPTVLKSGQSGWPPTDSLFVASGRAASNDDKMSASEARWDIHLNGHGSVKLDGGWPCKQQLVEE